MLSLNVINPQMNKESHTALNDIPTILVVGGSDSSGGAGIQADCAVARFHHTMPICAISCITSQGISGLKMISPADEAIFASQLDVAFDEMKPAGVKIGMIPAERLINILIDKLEYYRPSNVVLDPVMGATSGRKDVCNEMWRNPDIFSRISPYLNLITPNIPEALSMADLDWHIAGQDDAMRLAAEIKGKYQFKNVLLKGGHLESPTLSDCLLDEDNRFFHYSHPAIITRNNHGTGCALSTAIVCNLISGKQIPEACDQSIHTLGQKLNQNSDLVFFSDSSAKGPAFF